MAEGNKLSRRDFIKISTLSAGALAVAAGGVRLIESFSTAHRPGTLFFTEHEYKLVEAIAEQIIPADNWPGGKDAGVANFIDLQLTGPYRRFQEDYRKGLAALENTCLNKFHSRFENISWDFRLPYCRIWKPAGWKNMSGEKGSPLTSLNSSALIPCRDITAAPGMAAIKIL